MTPINPMNSNPSIPHPKKRGHVVRPDPFEDMTWNQKGFPKARLHRALGAYTFVDSGLVTPGWILTVGPAGTLLLGPVLHPGDLDRRAHDLHGTVYGSVRKLLDLGLPQGHDFPATP